MKAVSVIKAGLLVAMLTIPTVAAGQTQPTAGAEPWYKIVTEVIAIPSGLFGLLAAWRQLRTGSLEKRKLELEILEMSRRLSLTPEPVRAIAEPMSTSLARYLTVSYLGMRRAVGIIALMLPFTLVFGGMILQGTRVQTSISGYYYTDMRNVFVGALCAIGVLLILSRGYDRRDQISGYLAGFFAIGLALFPTAPYVYPRPQEQVVAFLHFSFASLFFLTLAYMSLVLFPKTNPFKKPTPKKLMRNRVYRLSGLIILICIVLLVIRPLLPLKTSTEPNLAFMVESIAFIAFGISWLTKGESLLKDQGS